VDPIEKRMDETEWEYGDKDLAAIDELSSRIAATGKKFGLISYTDLVSGVAFHYPNINNGQPHFISVFGEWTGLDRRIIGDCLGYVSMRSYKEAKFMASALVIARTESKPSDMFFQWMQTLGVLPKLDEMSVLKFWSEQVAKAHQWYKYGKKI
jgi:hypothetical protein